MRATRATIDAKLALIAGDTAAARRNARRGLIAIAAAAVALVVWPRVRARRTRLAAPTRLRRAS